MAPSARDLPITGAEVAGTYFFENLAVVAAALVRNSTAGVCLLAPGKSSQPETADFNQSSFIKARIAQHAAGRSLFVAHAKTMN
jgi:hypothetical protein